MRLLPIILALTPMLAGCAWFDTKAMVRSDTRWSGDFNGRTVDGSGDREVSLGSGSQIKCAVVQKQTSAGRLTVEISGNEKTTTASFGVVSVCSD